MRLPAVEMQIKKIGEVRTSESGKDWCNVMMEHKDGKYTDLYEVGVFDDQIERVRAMGVGAIANVSLYMGSRKGKSRYFTSLRLAFIEQVDPVREEQGDDDTPF